MDTLPLNHTQWSDKLAFDVALTLEGSGESMNEIIQRHRISSDQMLRYNSDPVFLKKVESYRGDIREKGMTFKLKARAQAEELLTTSWMLIHDPGVSPSVKADLIKSTVKWGGLEPQKDAASDGASGGVKISINLGGSNDAPQIINATNTYEEDNDESDSLLLPNE